MWSYISSFFYEDEIVAKQRQRMRGVVQSIDKGATAPLTPKDTDVRTFLPKAKLLYVISHRTSKLQYAIPPAPEETRYMSHAKLLLSVRSLEHDEAPAVGPDDAGFPAEEHDGRPNAADQGAVDVGG